MQKQQLGPAKPQGNPAAANLQNAANRITNEEKSNGTPKIKTPDTMFAIIKDDRFPYVSEALSLFLERKFSPDIHKALTIHIFSQTILQHDMGIIEASKLSASTTGLSDQVIRRWATEYYSTTLRIWEQVHSNCQWLFYQMGRETYGIANQDASTIAQTLVDELFCHFSSNCSM